MIIESTLDFLEIIKKKMVIVSVIIVNYNGKHYLDSCLKSVLNVTFPKADEYEVIVVDNASRDGSVEFINKNYPQVKLICLKKNLGFAGGNNHGIKASIGKYISLLNNDTVVKQDWLKGLVEIIETDDRIGFAGSKILFLDNPDTINNAGSYLTITGEGGDIGYKEKDRGQYNNVQEVFSVCAASCIVRREVFEQIGYFDESFFAYYEDTDLCYRARLIGWKCFYCPTSVVYHKHCGTSVEWSPMFTFYAFRNKLFIHLKNSPFRLLFKVFTKYIMTFIRDVFIDRSNRKIHLKIILSLITNFPSLFFKRLNIRMKQTIPDNVILSLLSPPGLRKKTLSQFEIKKIGIYNPSLPVMGGGENHMAVLIESFEKLFPKANVDIIVHNMAHYVGIDDPKYPTVGDLEKNYGVKLNRTVIKKIILRYQRILNLKIVRNRLFLSTLVNNLLLSKMTREYDIFVNLCFQSTMPAYGKINFYFCMFPPRCYKIKGKTVHEIFQKFIVDITENFVETYDLFCSISQYTQEYIEKYLSIRSTVLYPSIDSLNQKVINYGEKKNYIISIGRFFVNGHNKKHDVLIDAFKKFYDGVSVNKKNDIKLFLVGRSDQGEKSQLYINKLIDAAKGYPIIFKFYLAKSNLENLLNECKIYWHATGFGENLDLNPDKAEHFGITTVEAMSHGVIPVVINKGGQRELVIQGYNGFLWNTIEELVDYTKNIIFNDRTDVHEMSKNAVNFTEKFSRKSHDKELKNILSKFIEFEDCQRNY